jgi:hypothetical protein
MKLGDTIIATDGSPSTDSHLWIIASDPQKDEARVLIVNLTTASNHHDKSCICRQGDHPFITHDSCINYQRSYILSISTIKARLDKGIVEQREPVNRQILQRIWDGADKSEHIPIDHWKLLVDQGFIEN